MIKRHDLRVPEDRTPTLCTKCHRSIEWTRDGWMHRWPLPGADHPAQPPRD